MHGLAMSSGGVQFVTYSPSSNLIAWLICVCAVDSGVVVIPEDDNRECIIELIDEQGWPTPPILGSFVGAAIGNRPVYYVQPMADGSCKHLDEVLSQWRETCPESRLTYLALSMSGPAARLNALPPSARACVRPLHLHRHGNNPPQWKLEPTSA